MFKGFGYLIYLCLVILLGAVVAYAAKRSRRPSNRLDGKKTEKPSFVEELGDRLKDPYKPTDY